MNRNVPSFEPANFVLAEFVMSAKVSKLLKKKTRIQILCIIYKIEIITMVTKCICTPLHLLLHLYTDSLDPSVINLEIDFYMITKI